MTPADALLNDMLEEANGNPLKALSNHRRMMTELSQSMAQIPFSMVEVRPMLLNLAAMYLSVRIADKRSTSLPA